MEAQSNKCGNSSPLLSPESDSAIETMSDLTPEEEIRDGTNMLVIDSSPNEIKHKLNVSGKENNGCTSKPSEEIVVLKDETLEPCKFTGSLNEEEGIIEDSNMKSEISDAFEFTSNLTEGEVNEDNKLKSETLDPREFTSKLGEEVIEDKLEDEAVDTNEIVGMFAPDIDTWTEHNLLTKKMYVYAYSDDDDDDDDDDDSDSDSSSKDLDVQFKGEDEHNTETSSNSKFAVEDKAKSVEDSIGENMAHSHSQVTDKVEAGVNNSESLTDYPETEDKPTLEKDSYNTTEREQDEAPHMDAMLHINKAGIVEEFISNSRVLSPFEKSHTLVEKWCDVTDGDENDVLSVQEKEGNDDCVENSVSTNMSDERELDEHLDNSKHSLSHIISSSEKASVFVDAPLEENLSLIDSEEEMADISESEMVVSASMQFTLTPSPANPAECNVQLIEQEEVPKLSSSPGGVPIHVKHQKEQLSPINKEPSDTEEDTKGDALDEPPPSKVNHTPSSRVPSSLKLPDTVSRLTTEEGSEVFVVGTAHFSKESQEDVASTIRMVRPDVVVVELCKSRTAFLQLDEETTLNESKSLDFNKMCFIVRQHGKVQGILYLLLLSVSAHITKQLGMAPGGEFRAAFAEVRRSVPGCSIHLGDRPIQITLSRALASLSVWQKIKLMWHIMASKGPISKEEVEKCKQRDFIEEVLDDMTGQFPVISEVFVKERDIYLTKSLQIAAHPIPNPNSPTGFSPRVVVGVVGIGHVPGIVEHWDKITDKDIPPIMSIPPPNLSDRVFKFTVKFTFYGLVGYSVYKCLPSSTKSAISSAIESGVNNISKYFVK